MYSIQKEFKVLKEKADEELFKETLTKFGELKEIIGTKFSEKVESFIEGVYHNTQTGSEQFKKGVNPYFAFL